MAYAALKRAVAGTDGRRTVPQTHLSGIPSGKMGDSGRQATVEFCLKRLSGTGSGIRTGRLRWPGCFATAFPPVRPLTSALAGVGTRAPSGASRRITCRIFRLWRNACCCPAVIRPNLASCCRRWPFAAIQCCTTNASMPALQQPYAPVPQRPAVSRHNDTRHLTRRLEKNGQAGQFGHKSYSGGESLYSMDGDSPDFARTCAGSRNGITPYWWQTRRTPSACWAQKAEGWQPAVPTWLWARWEKRWDCSVHSFLLPRGGTELLCNLASAPSFTPRHCPTPHAACAAMLPRRIARMEEQRDRVAPAEPSHADGTAGAGAACARHRRTSSRWKQATEALTSRTAAALRQHGILALAARHPTVHRTKSRSYVWGMTALAFGPRRRGMRAEPYDDPAR